MRLSIFWVYWTHFSLTLSESFAKISKVEEMVSWISLKALSKESFTHFL